MSHSFPLAVTSVLQVTVDKNLCLQTQTVCIKVNDGHGTIPVGVVTLCEAVLVELGCDSVEHLWQQSETTTHVRITNW